MGGCRGRALCPRAPQGASSSVLSLCHVHPHSCALHPLPPPGCVTSALGEGTAAGGDTGQAGRAAKSFIRGPSAGGGPRLELEIDRQWPPAGQAIGPGPGVTLPAPVGGNPELGEAVPNKAALCGSLRTFHKEGPAAAPSLQGPLVPPCGPGQENRPWWPEEARECARPAGIPQRPGPGHPPPWSQTETCVGDPGFPERTAGASLPARQRTEVQQVGCTGTQTLLGRVCGDSCWGHGVSSGCADALRPGSTVERECTSHSVQSRVHVRKHSPVPEVSSSCPGGAPLLCSPRGQ